MMKRNWHDQSRITEQLKFFKHKPKKFISCYAKKPRISMIPDRYKFDLNPLYGNAARDAMRNNRYAYQQQTYNGQLLGLLGQNQSMAAAQGQFGGLIGGGALGGCLGSGFAGGFQQ